MTLWSFLQISPKASKSISFEQYADQLGFYYSFDSTVANHARVKVNDRALIIDEKSILGLGTINKIEIEAAKKNRRRCPSCASTKISPRLETFPRFRCSKCEKEFDNPAVEVIDVVSYKAFYGSNWKRVEGISKELINAAYFSRAVQQSIRELNIKFLPENFINDLEF